MRCCEQVRVALLQAAARTGGTKQGVTLVVELGSWLEGEGAVSTWPLALMLRVARELHEVCNHRYMSKADPLIITRVPQISRLWAMARPFLSDDLRRRLVVIPNDAELVSVLENYVPPGGVPVALRRRALRAHLLTRPSREQLVSRRVLPAEPADPAAVPLLLPQPAPPAGLTATTAPSPTPPPDQRAASQTTTTTTSTTPPRALWCLFRRLVGWASGGEGGPFRVCVGAALLGASFVGAAGWSLLWLGLLYFLIGEAHTARVRQHALHASAADGLEGWWTGGGGGGGGGGVAADNQEDDELLPSEEDGWDRAGPWVASSRYFTAAASEGLLFNQLEPLFANEANDGSHGGGMGAAGGGMVAAGCGGGSAHGGGGASGGGGAFCWQHPAWFNEFARRVWRRAKPDLSRRLQHKLAGALRGGAEGLLASVSGEIGVKLDLGHEPPKFHRLRVVGDSPHHVRIEAEVRWGSPPAPPCTSYPYPNPQLPPTPNPSPPAPPGGVARRRVA